MSTCRGDNGSTVNKRSFSDMDNNEAADSVSVTKPKVFRDNYFIAIREKKISGDDGDDDYTTTLKPKDISNRSCCIFGCWDDAQMYLKQLQLEGRNVEYDAFEGLEAATRYAFGKDALQKNEFHDGMPSDFLRVFPNFIDSIITHEFAVEGCRDTQ